MITHYVASIWAWAYPRFDLLLILADSVLTGVVSKMSGKRPDRLFSAGVSLEPVNQSRHFPYLTSSLPAAWCWPSASCQRTFF